MNEIQVIFDSGQDFAVDFDGGAGFDCKIDGILPGDYHGEYQVTPSSETQTLETAGKSLTFNIVIDPIPQNYGLITWNGSALTVS